MSAAAKPPAAGTARAPARSADATRANGAGAEATGGTSTDAKANALANGPGGAGTKAAPRPTRTRPRPPAASHASPAQPLRPRTGPDTKRTFLGWIRAWLRPPRRLKFTREGKFFVGITLGVGFAAINTANNLLYLLLGMLLALIVVSGLMSEVSLSELTVVRRLPLRAQVGRAHLVEIEVFNHKGRIPSYAIEVEDLRAGQPADKRCFFLKISPKSAQVAAYRRTPTKRGRDLHVGFRIATRFPFGLFEKSREIAAEGDLIIYPGVDPVHLPASSAGKAPGGDGTVGRGNGDDFLGLKLMRSGEDPRDIHWRKSAAAGQLVMRERAREARPDVALPLDVVRPESGGDDWDIGFERRIRDVASRAVAHLKRGDSVLVRTNAGGTARADRTAGADPILRFLALVQAVPAALRRSLAPATQDAKLAKDGKEAKEATEKKEPNDPKRAPAATHVKAS